MNFHILPNTEALPHDLFNLMQLREFYGVGLIIAHDLLLEIDEDITNEWPDWLINAIYFKFSNHTRQGVFLILATNRNF